MGSIIFITTDLYVIIHIYLYYVFFKLNEEYKLKYTGYTFNRDLGSILTWQPSTNFSVDKNISLRSFGVGHLSDGKNLFLLTNVDIEVFSWIIAYFIPMQFLIPALNGKNAYGCRLRHASGRKLSGLNFSGSV